MEYDFYIALLRNTSPTAFVAKLISFTIKRKYNHMEVVAVPKDSNQPMIWYGAKVPESKRSFEPEILAHYEVIEMIKINKKSRYSDFENIKYLESLCGRKYSRLQVTILLFMACSYWLKAQLAKMELNYDHLLICTEMCAMFIGERFSYKLRTSYDAAEFEDVKQPLLEQF